MRDGGNARDSKEDVVSPLAEINSQTKNLTERRKCRTGERQREKKMASGTSERERDKRKKWPGKAWIIARP